MPRSESQEHGLVLNTHQLRLIRRTLMAHIRKGQEELAWHDHHNNLDIDEHRQIRKGIIHAKEIINNKINPLVSEYDKMVKE